MIFIFFERYAESLDILSYKIKINIRLISFMKTKNSVFVLLCSCFFVSWAYADGTNPDTDANYPSKIEAIHTETQQKDAIESFQVINAFYARDPNAIFVIDNDREKWIHLSEADYETFEVISGRFAKDISNFYNTYQIMHGVDPDSFVVISAEHGYAGDDDSIYGPKGLIQKADPDTFRMLNKNYSQDISSVYFQWRELSWADAGSIENLWENHARDKNFVFYKDAIIAWADPKWFKTTGLYTGVDKNGVQYFENNKVNILPDPEETDDKVALENDTDQKKPNNGNTDKEDKNDDNAEVPPTAKDPDSAPDDDTDTTNNDPKYTSNMSWLEKVIQRITGTTIDLQKIHIGYALLLPLVLFAGIAAIYQLFAKRFGKNISILRALINTAISMIVSCAIVFTLTKLTNLSNAYGLLILFFGLFFVILWLLGILPLRSLIKNLGISAITSIIGAIVSMIAFLSIDKFVDTQALIDTTSDPLVFTNLTLTLASIFLLTILYKSATSANWIGSIIRVIIATIVGIALTILSQQIFGYVSLLLTVAIFHVFVLIVLILIGLRSSDQRLLHAIHATRSVFIHFIIMFVIFFVITLFI